MAKKSRKRPARLKNDNAGCMRGLISIFDFRQGPSTRRLLSDKRLGSASQGGTIHSKNEFDVLSNSERTREEDASDVADVERINSSSIVERRVEMCVGANTGGENQMKTIDRLNSNKDMLQKLLQDHDALLFKHVQDLQNTRTHEIFHGSEQEELSHKQNRHHFFRKKDRSDGANPKNDNTRQDLKRIVVLKPGTDATLHDSRHQEGTDKVSSHFSIKEIKRRMRNMVGESRKKRDSIARDGILHKIPYGGNNKASKFSTFLKKGDRDVDLGSQTKVKRLIVSHPLDKESEFYDEAKKRLAEILGLDAENEVTTPRRYSWGRMQSLTGYRSLSLLSPRSSPAREDASTCGVSSSPSTGDLPCSENHSDDGSPPINSDPHLLETQFSEEINSNTLERTEIDHGTTPTTLQYVRSVLEASGLDCNKHPSERWQSSDRLLDPFVYDEVEIPIDGSKLVFDCIDEVLAEMKERDLSRTPWISCIRPNIRPPPTGESFVHQVCKGVVDKHLQIVVPYTLAGVIRKDLECRGTWMNVWMESECAVAEIGEVILEYIMEETILELWE